MIRGLIHAHWAKTVDKHAPASRYSLGVSKAFGEESGQAGELSESQLMEKMRELFMEADENSDGVLSFEEFRDFYQKVRNDFAGCQNLMDTLAEETKVFDAIDTDGSGFIDFKEFMEWQQEERKRSKRKPASKTSTAAKVTSGFLSARRHLKSPDPQRALSPMPPEYSRASTTASTPGSRRPSIANPAGSRQPSKQASVQSPMSPVPPGELPQARSNSKEYAASSPIPPTDGEQTLKFGPTLSLPGVDPTPNSRFGRRKSAPVAVDGRMREAEVVKPDTQKRSVYERLLSPRGAASSKGSKEPIAPKEVSDQKMRWERGQWRKKTGHQAMLDLGDFETKLKTEKQKANAANVAAASGSFSLQGGYRKTKNAQDFKTFGSDWSED